MRTFLIFVLVYKKVITMQESSLYHLSYRTVMFERRAGIEPAVTIRCKQTFGPSLRQLRSLPPLPFLSFDNSHRQESGLNLYQVCLVGYYLLNVLIGSRCLLHIFLRADGMNDALCFKLSHFLL